MQPEAFVEGLSQGTFLVRRAGMVARATDVWLSPGGDATAGEDILALPTRIAFSAWQTAAYIDVVPLAGAVIEGAREAVVLSVRTDPAGQYVAGTPAQATVWLYADAAAAVDGNDDGIPDAADPDSDGLSTAEELVMGSDPSVPTLVLQAGWNLVSVPGLPAGEQTLAAQLGAEFSGVVWGWEGDHYTAVVDEPLEPGRGYLIMVREPTVIDLHDLAPSDGTVAFGAGWNLLGPIHGGAWTGPASAFLYRFEEGEYVLLDAPRLRPMTGYWVFLEEDTTIDLP